MKTKTIEARRIGWMVEWRNGGLNYGEWVGFSDSTRDRRHDAIKAFNKRCRFMFVRKEVLASGGAYQSLRRRGLARCVLVYVQAEER